MEDDRKLNNPQPNDRDLLSDEPYVVPNYQHPNFPAEQMGVELYEFLKANFRPHQLALIYLALNSDVNEAINLIEQEYESTVPDTIKHAIVAYANNPNTKAAYDAKYN